MKNLKKGFTLVELVIVIAVIAVLAAVLIPTFSGIVQRAKVSSDIQLAKQLNTVTTGATTIEEVVALVEAEENLTADHLIPQVAGNKFVWAKGETTGQILYVDSNFKRLDGESENYDYTGKTLWTVVKNPGHIMKNPSKAINYFLAQDTNQNFVINSISGFNTGDNVLSGTLTIDSDSQGTALVDGNFTGKVTIDTPNADVTQYGSIKTLDVTAVKDGTLSLNGFVEGLNVAKGKIALSQSSYVKTLTVSSSNVKVANDGMIQSLKTAENVKIPAANFQVGEGTVVAVDSAVKFTDAQGADVAAPENIQKEGFTFHISDIAGLESFRDAVNGGATYQGLTVELKADITLPNGWTPIGNFARAKEALGFQGVFNGNDFTISNLNNIGYNPKVLFSNDSTINGKQEFSYGLFGFVSNSAEIKNLKLEDVNINIPHDSAVYGDSVGALIGYSYGKVTLSDITIGVENDQGIIAAYDGVGSMIGRAYGDGALTLTDCINHVQILGHEKAAGLIGYASGPAITLTDSENHSVVTVDAKGLVVSTNNVPRTIGHVAGLVTAAKAVHVVANSCLSTGNVVLTSPVGATIAWTLEAEGLVCSLGQTVPNATLNSTLATGSITINGTQK